MAAARYISSSSMQLWCAGALGIIATAVAAVLPALLAVWQAQAGLSVSQSGLVASTELLAQVIGTGLFVWATQKRSLKAIAVTGLIGMIVGNLSSAFSFDLRSLILTRAFAGLSGGIVRALCMMELARARTPGRAIAVYAGAQVALAAAVTNWLPVMVSRFGTQSPFLVIAVESAIGLALCVQIPGGLTARSSVRQPFFVGSRPALIAVLGLFLYFLGQGAVWTYLEPIGRGRAIPAEGISRALALLNLAGLAGALGIGALAYRLKPSSVMLVLLALGLVSLGGIFNASSAALFTVSACGFYFAWCASVPFQFAVVAGADLTGRTSAFTPAVDGLGLAVGATLAGELLPVFGLHATGWVCAVSSIAGIACFIACGTLLKSQATASKLATSPYMPLRETSCR